MKFHDSNVSKLRPAIVVSNSKSIDIDVIMINVSSAEPRNEFDVTIEYWQEAGLLKPSIARTTKIVAISQSQLLRKLGKLQPFDLERIIKKCREMF